MYPETRFMTSAQQEKAFKRFQRVIDKRDSSLIDKNLYEHLHLHCGFIAHYDIHGFRATYSGIEGFRRFVEHFDIRIDGYWKSCWIEGDYVALNTDMVNYVMERADQIYAELDHHKRNAELALAHALLEKHGFNVETTVANVPVLEEESGQLVIGF